MTSRPPAHNNPPAPRHVRGRRIGLLGGSFNPPHAGHRLLSKTALNKLKLDSIWWLVSPGNPLKSHENLKPLEERLQACRALTAGDPRVLVTGMESRLGTHYTLDTVTALKKLYPETDFVWICGQDIPLDIHRWNRWQALVSMIPFACMARPPHVGLIRNHTIRRHRDIREIYIAHGQRVDLKPKHWFWLLTGNPTSALSSSLLRRVTPC